MVVSSPDIHMFGQNIPEHNPALSRAGDPLPRSASPDILCHLVVCPQTPHCERAARETEKAEAVARAVAELKVQIEAKRRFLRS